MEKEKYKKLTVDEKQFWVASLAENTLSEILIDESFQDKVENLIIGDPVLKEQIETFRKLQNYFDEFYSQLSDDPESEYM